RLYLSNTSLSPIIDDEKIPVLRRMKTDDSGLELTKEVLPGDNALPKPKNLKNLLIHKAKQFWCDLCDSAVEYPVLRYRLELEVSDDTVEAVVIMFDEITTRRRRALWFAYHLGKHYGNNHTLELKSHTYYEHRNYKSFTCWRVFTNDAVEESSISWMVAAKANSKAHAVKRLNEGPSVTTPSKWSETKKHGREELEDSDAEESFVVESHGFRLLHPTRIPAKGGAHLKRKATVSTLDRPFSLDISDKNRIDHSINVGRGLYTFRINGQNYHRIGLSYLKRALSLGIASLLLPTGRTAHNRFVIPLELLENSNCGIKQNTHFVKLMQEIELIIWDEASMTQKYAFEALDKTLRDILGYPATANMNKIFCGLTVLLGDDFRQILSVIPKGKRFMRYIDGRKDYGKMLKDLIENGPYQMYEITDQGNPLVSSFLRFLKEANLNPNDIYNSVEACKTAQLCGN
nr:ATP-dependent DNA helicase PIF7-like [Tanacetum cinerariifolium]